MKKFLLIALILSLIFVVLNYGFNISFNLEIVDLSILYGFLILLIIHLTYPFVNIWMKIAISSLALIIIIAGWFYWEIFGYESRVYETWNLNNYYIQLEHRLELTGPGNYWIIAYKKIGENFMYKETYRDLIEDEKIKSGRTIKLIIGSDSLKLSCCKNEIIKIR